MTDKPQAIPAWLLVSLFVFYGFYIVNSTASVFFDFSLTGALRNLGDGGSIIGWFIYSAKNILTLYLFFRLYKAFKHS